MCSTSNCPWLLELLRKVEETVEFKVRREISMLWCSQMISVSSKTRSGMMSKMLAGGEMGPSFVIIATIQIAKMFSILCVAAEGGKRRARKKK